jgi:hypothetical protein
MSLRIVLLSIVLSMGIGAAEAAQQESWQAKQPPVAVDQQPVNSYFGTLEQEGEDFVLKAQDQSYRLELQNGAQAESMVGEEVEVRGWLEGETIHAEAISTAFDVPVGPRAPEGGQQPMAGEGNMTGGDMGHGGADHQMSGQESNQSIDHLGPGGAAAPGAQQQDMGGNQTEQPMAGEGNMTGGDLGESGAEQPMSGQEGNYTGEGLGPGGVFPEGWVPPTYELGAGNQTGQPMGGQQGNQTGQ